MKFRAGMLGALLLGISIPSPFTKKHRERPDAPRTVATATPTPAPSPGPALSEAEVTEFLRAWPAYDAAMSTLGRAPIPADNPTDPLAGADAGIAESDAVREALDHAAVDSDRFLDLYRRTAQTWYALQQADEREETDGAIDKQIAALEKVAARDPGARATADRMRKTRAAQEAEDDQFPPSAQAIAVVKAHRSALTRIFGAAE